MDDEFDLDYSHETSNQQGVYYEGYDLDALLLSLEYHNPTMLVELIGRRLKMLREVMSKSRHAISAYIVPTADAHNSEYISDADARRAWLTGFSGSAGTAVITATRALVWTDGRYFTQFLKETAGTPWELMKMNALETPTIPVWLAENLPPGSVVAVDPLTYSHEEWMQLEKELSKNSMRVIALKHNLVDETRMHLADPAPARPCTTLRPLPVEYTGKTAGEKIRHIRQKMMEKHVSALVVSALDEIAYTLNLRASDIMYNPVLFAYLVVETSQGGAEGRGVTLFWGTGQLQENVLEHLAREGLPETRCMPYTDVLLSLHQLADALEIAKKKVWLPDQANEALHQVMGYNCSALSDIYSDGGYKRTLQIVTDYSPVGIMKIFKNEVELQGMRACHVRDGVALCRFLHWISGTMAAGEVLTELGAADMLQKFRAEEPLYMGDSFETIPATGAHGAIIHYHPVRDPPTIIQPGDIFLVDSGGQYLDGTTDVTRTRCLGGTPSNFHRQTYTRVLKGQIALATSIFPRGVKGNVLDTLARKALWDVGLDYAHGTGHGVGHHLNVHEGPSGISWRPMPHDPGLQPNMIFSNEPGYYLTDNFGIRLEDVIATVGVTRTSGHPLSEGLLGDMEGKGVLGFETLTLAPHQRDMIDVSLLTDFELQYLNRYHGMVLREVGNALLERQLNDVYEWLRAECSPLNRTVDWYPEPCAD